MALARPCFSTNERFTFLGGPQQGNKRWCGTYKAQRSHLHLFVVINVSFLWVKCQPSIRNRTLLSTEHPLPPENPWRRLPLEGKFQVRQAEEWSSPRSTEGMCIPVSSRLPLPDTLQHAGMTSRKKGLEEGKYSEFLLL